jgi:5-methylcytosine-specific restriction endonuclease McrA
MSKDWRKKNSNQRGYTYRWQRERETYLKMNPLCVYCFRDDRLKEASVVDHIKPHKGNQVLFWDVNNWQSLCHSCHSSIKQREERGCVYIARIGLDGWPEGYGGDKNK